MLWFGQILNAAVALSVYRLGWALLVQHRITEPERGPWRYLRPALAALLVGFAFQMPAYYLTWGRYTLLTGLIVLGPALAAALEFSRRPRALGAGIRLVMLLAGLCMAHYLALVLALLFLGVLGLAALLRAVLRRDARWLPWRLVAFSLLGGLLAAPWLWRVWSFNRMAGVSLTLPEGGSPSAFFSPQDWQYLYFLLGPRHNHILLILAGVGLLFALRRPVMRLLVAWALLLGLLTLPFGLRLGPFRPDHYAIVLFFPAALLLADLLVSAAAAAGRVFRPWVGHGALLLVAGGLLLWGARETRSVVNPVTVFVTQGDVQALNWVREHTAPDARFFINSTLWMGPIYRGVDGGFWLLPYTGRGSLVPPVIYNWGPSTYDQQVQDWADRSSKLTGCTPDFWRLMRDANLSYIYIHQGVGNLQPGMLSECARLQEVYADQDVFIYKVIPLN